MLPLYTALVMVLFALRHNLPPDVLAELFGSGSTTVERYQDTLERLIDEVLTPLYEQVREQGHRDAVLVDGLVVPIDRVADQKPFYSGKHRRHGVNVQVLADSAGRLVWASPALPGAVHDLSAARTHALIDALTDARVMTVADKTSDGRNCQAAAASVRVGKAAASR